MTNDTASVPGEDLRALGIEAPQMELGLLVTWAAEEWGRLGQFCPVTSSAHWLSVGRGADSPGGHRRAQWMQQRAGEHVWMPPLATSTTSADQLLVKVAPQGLELHNIGRHPMFVNRREVQRSTVESGDLIYLHGQFVLKCVRRPLPMPPLRHLHARYMGTFGLPNPFHIVGEAPETIALFEQAAYAAKDVGEHVLIHGQSGTGKESIAGMIHGMSALAAAPFVSVSAANLAPSLLEDMLFGHVKDYPQKGMEAKKGAIGEANGGTLFIDELGRMQPEAQAALLRVLACGEYRVLGGEGVSHSRFRLIAAMNGPITALLHDLYKRLVLKVQMPLLVDRSDDIPLIVRHILRQKHADLTRHLVRKQADGTEEIVPPFSFIEDLMKRESFDGNVRDLSDAVSKMLFDTTPAQQGGEVQVRGSDDADRDDPDEVRGRDLKKEEIEWALGKHANNVSAAAANLGVSRASLYRAMERVGVRRSG